MVRLFENNMEEQHFEVIGFTILEDFKYGNNAGKNKLKPCISIYEIHTMKAKKDIAQAPQMSLVESKIH